MFNLLQVLQKFSVKHETPCCKCPGSEKLSLIYSSGICLPVAFCLANTSLVSVPHGAVCIGAIGVQSGIMCHPTDWAAFYTCFADMLLTGVKDWPRQETGEAGPRTLHYHRGPPRSQDGISCRAKCCWCLRVLSSSGTM